MSNFFFRQSDLKQSDFETSARVRNNAYVRILDDKGVQILPVDLQNSTTKRDSTANTLNYSGQMLGPSAVGTGKPAPILGEVKIALEGEYGSLKKAEFSFVCFDVQQFNNLEPKMLKAGQEITIKYGYAGPLNVTQKGEGEFRIYDFSFKITPENNFECKVKAVGKGNDFEGIEMSGAFPDFKDKSIVTNYSGTNKRKLVQNYFDYWDYDFQVAYGRNDSKNFKEADGSVIRRNLANSTAKMLYEDNSSGKTVLSSTNLAKQYAILKAPSAFEASTRQNLGAGTRNRLFYTNLVTIVHQFNTIILKDSGYRIAFHKEWSKLNYSYSETNSRGTVNKLAICSAQPFEMLFPYNYPANYGGGTYDPYDENKDVNGIKMRRFNNVRNAAPELALDGNVQLGLAGGILICREMLRAIEIDFNNAAKRETASTEEKDKADGGFDVEKFFKKLFASIRDNSGGAFDLYLEHRDGFDDVIFIVNKKSPLGNEKITAVKLDPISGKNGIREIAIEGKVPKDIQAKAFGGDATTTKSVDIMTDDEQETADEAAADEGADLPTRYVNARQDMSDRDYSSDCVTALKSVLKDIVLARDTKDVGGGGNIEPPPYPLSFNATFDGIEGLNFGDTFTSSYLPERYRFPDGLRVVFTLIKYEHVIKDNDWSTSIECMARIVDEKVR
jgi:hypothetical protein